MSQWLGTYVQSLTRQARELDVRRRTAFAAWCLESLFTDCEQHLAGKGGEGEANVLRVLLNAMWQHALGASQVSEREVDRLHCAVMSLDYREDEDIGEHEIVLDQRVLETLNCAVEAVAVLRDGSASSAAAAARCVLNQVDFELTMEPATRALENIEEAMIQRELERQQQMIVFLKTASALTDADRSLFAQRWKSGPDTGAS